MLAQSIARVVCYDSCCLKYSRGVDTEATYCRIGSLWALHINNKVWVQVVLHYADRAGCRAMHLSARRQL